VRRPQDVVQMEKHYGWPRAHRHGFPDLVGPEVDIHRMIEPFNADHKNVQIVLVNQFGWSRDRIGKRLPREMGIDDLRHATDVEFGMATYEPFGISPLEPLGSGAICVISNVCGCEGFVRHVTDGKPVPNVIEANFTQLDRPLAIPELLAMTCAERNRLEAIVAAQVADQLIERLPSDDAGRKKLLQAGQTLIKRMGWDQVIEEGFLPLLRRIAQPPSQINE
jgi:hypothetical protein